MTPQGSESIAYPIGAAIMSPLGLENDYVEPISIIPNRIQIWKQFGKHSKFRTVAVVLPVLQIPALLFGI